MTTLLKEGKRIRFLIASLFVLMGFASQAQVILKGKVTGPNGAAISNASVQVEPSNAGTNTDASGNYSITTTLKPGKYTLVFSSVGYKRITKAITVSGNDAFDNDVVFASDPLGLDEVVVTGTSAGTTKKQLGSYISVVKADQLTKGAAGNVLAALQGKTAGAQITQNSGDPAGGMSVRLRGISSVNSSSEPLYIIDGVIINNATNRVTNTSGNYDGNNFVGTIGQNRLSDINPADIERVEVLNGAAAAAIYGSRANAGVVQIFTKRGSSGAPVISFSTSVISSKLRKSVEVNQSPTKFGGSVDAQTQDILTPALITITPVTRYNYNDYIFRTAIGTDNNVSISGGKDKTKYYASGSYYNNQGIIKNTNFKRYSFRVNLDQAIGDKVNFNMGLNYVNSLSNEKPDGNSFFSPMNSINIIGNFHDLFTRDVSGNIKSIGERGRVNPVSVIEDIKQQQETNRLIAGVGLKVRPFKGLSIDYQLGIDQYGQKGQTLIPPFAYIVSDGFFGGGVVATNLDAARNGYASSATNNFFQINNELNATYQFDINKNIGSTTQVGYSVQYEKNSYVLAQGRGLAPFISSVGAATTALPSADERSEISVSGYYVQQNFKFKNILFLSGAVRVDGSSVYDKSERSQVYTKASASYVISEQDFWKKMSLNKYWNFAKLRVAYGQSGNLTGIGAYSRFNSYSGNSFVGKGSITSSTVLANELVKPERQSEIEFGLELGFLDSRVNFQANVYTKNVKDLLLNRFIAPTTGYSSYLNNFGSLENKGFELMLTGKPIQNKNMNWTITGIYNHNRNKAKNITQALTLLATNSGAPVAIIEGQPIGVFYGAFFALDGSGNLVKNAAGFPQGERGIQTGPLDFNVVRDANGIPVGTNPLVRKVIGDPNPDYTTSLVNEFSYKNFSLRVQLDAVKGVEVFNADWRTRQGVGNGKEAEKEQTGVYPRGYINSFYGAIEEWRIDNGSFVKLRELSLSYSLGKVKWFKDITATIAGRNLVSWDNYKGYDPEVNAGGQSTVLRGIDFGAVPIPKTFSVGISAKF
jgi:TonB-linked SusC/RagA family outer membrane protein